MRLGLFTPLLNALGFQDLLEELKRYPQITMLELGTGGWPGCDHPYLDLVRDSGLAISALSCHGNPLHPDPKIACDYDKLFRQTVLLAEQHCVPVVVTFSGCPGDSDGAKHPNWITSPWPPEFLDVLEWQWEKKAIPYWTDAAKFAADHGVKVALEAHPNFIVYNVETLLKLRAAVGKNLGINFDPSHFFWQGVDASAAIRALGDAIFHVHAKDVAIDPHNVAVNGVIDTKSYHRMADRSWLYRSVGWGHGELEWKRIVSALRLAGYDYVMSIEHEDALASVDEGLKAAVDLLSRVILTEPPVKAWWT